MTGMRAWDRSARRAASRRVNPVLLGTEIAQQRKVITLRYVEPGVDEFVEPDVEEFVERYRVALSFTNHLLTGLQRDKESLDGGRVVIRQQLR